MSEHRTGPSFAALNNDAVHNIQVSDFRGANQCLFSALVATRELLRRSGGQQNDHSSTVSNGNSLTNINDFYSFCPNQQASCANIGAVPNDPQADSTSSATQLLHVRADASTAGSSSMSQGARAPLSPPPPIIHAGNDELFLFRRPLEVNLRAIEHPDSLPIVVERMGSFAIVYNLALCNHLQGLATADETKLKRAVELYDSAAHLLDSFSLQQEEVSFFAIVVLNNAGHAHNSLRCLNRARLCFHQLAIAVSAFLFRNASAGTQEGNPQRRQLDRGFLFNVRKFGWTVPSIAAAAA